MSAPTTDLDDTAAYRLPASVRPHAYRLVLTPDLPGATFAGDVEIDVTIEEPTASITLNAADLEITFAELSSADPDDGYALAPSAIALDADRDVITGRNRSDDADRRRHRTQGDGGHGHGRRIGLVGERILGGAQCRQTEHQECQNRDCNRAEQPQGAPTHEPGCDWVRLRRR